MHPPLYEKKIDILELQETTRPILSNSFRTDPKDILARCTYQFIAHILRSSTKVEGIDMTGSRVGSAKLAMYNGFSAPQHLPRMIVDGEDVQEPKDLNLAKDRAESIFAHFMDDRRRTLNFTFTNSPSVDFFLDGEHPGIAERSIIGDLPGIH